MASEARKEALHYLFERVVEPMGYKFTPDEVLVDELLEAEVKLEQDLGAPFCPCHDWRFDVRSGEFLDAPELRIATFATKVEDGKVLVELKGA